MRGLRVLLLALAVALLLPLACTETGVVGGKCREGLTTCGGQCVDISTDHAHCGSCGHACAAGVQCVSGSCGSAAEGGVDGGRDADAAPTDSGDADVTSGDGGKPDAGDAGHPDAGDSGNPDADGGGNADGGEGGACTPPYNEPGRCGDCNTKCTAAAPICSPSDGGYACVPFCTAPLVKCGSQCVDTNSDPKHCGSCNKVCPTGLCQGGKCVGAKAGHIVAACMSYQQNFQTSSQTVLLGNAVFLPFANPMRILAYDQYVQSNVRQRVDQTIGWAAAARGRSYNITSVSTVAGVSQKLNVLDYDVFLVYDQPNAPAGALGSAGTAWATSLDAFARAGGVIVVLSGGDGVGEMPDLLTNSNLLPVSAESDVTYSQLYNRAPTDAIGVNVLTPFVGTRMSCTFTTSVTPDATTTFVISDQGPTGPVGSPVVVHRTALP